MAFDVVSIHEHRDVGQRFINNMPKTSLYDAHGVAPWGLIVGAYNVKIATLVKNVPAWAMTTNYDVMAKSDPATDEALAKLSEADSYAEKRHMLQALLADRFKLQIHPETEMATVYELDATPRTATLMTPVQGDIRATVSSCNPLASRTSRELQSKGCPFSFLLGMLRAELGADVLDHTGLSGNYAYHLTWSPSGATLDEGAAPYPRIEDAVREQLGLELKKTKAPVTSWVVDHIERPSEN